MGSLVFQATLGGQVNLNGPNTASTFDIAVPATTGTMVTTGDSGTVTNTMLAASAYNTPGTIGSGTANTGAFTTLSASSTVSGTGFSTYLASPPAIGGTAAAAGTFTTLSGTTSVTTPIVKSASSLTLQTNGTTAAITLNTSGALGVGSSPSYGTSGQILTSAGSGAAPTWTSVASTTSISNGTSNVSIATSGGAVTVATNGSTAVTYDTSQNATFAGYVNAPNTFGFKNRIINGAMVIDQRNAGASVTPTSGQLSLDRWKFFLSQTSKFSTQQNAGSVTPPAGFAKYLGVTSLSAYTVGASENFCLLQTFESSNVYDFAWGTANAKPVTLSFWVYSSLTGTFGGAVRNWAYTYSYPFTYTISSANTWTFITVNITAPTAGTWVMDASNNGAIELLFSLGTGATVSGTAGAWASANYQSATGATSVVGTNGATFYITGVQLEKGSTATSFDYRPYGTELALCQRYFEKSYNQDVVPGVASFTPGFASSTASSAAPTQANGCSFKVTKRANPTCVSYNAVTGASGSAYRVSDGANVAITLTSPGYSGIGYIDFASNSNGYYWHFTASSEL